MNSLLRRRARSAEGESSGGSTHRREVRVQDFEVHPDYNVPSPDRDGEIRDGSQMLQDDLRQSRGDLATQEEPGMALAVEDILTARVDVDDGLAGMMEPAATGRENVEGEDGLPQAADVGERELLQGPEVASLPPGFDGQVPPGPVEQAVTTGGAVGDSYIARSLDAMGTVLSSLLGRMASLEQQRSSGTPTSDGLEGQLQQMSLSAERRFREGRPLTRERPLASMERIMAGTFSSDSSETARLRAEEAKRVIPGGIMRPQQGPPRQQAMGEDWTSGFALIAADSSFSAGIFCASGAEADGADLSYGKCWHRRSSYELESSYGIFAVPGTMHEYVRGDLANVGAVPAYDRVAIASYGIVPEYTSSFDFLNGGLSSNRYMLEYHGRFSS
ncbi:unnamed protein product [Symbiodinium pilosum]|uniref:Uncharacterized protein n=1 Tax=Symbiodinium pilosum TaxID=2952 RepID=A0A812Q8P6_SYMPI|nr:unnamed protein product [Symbiodinium pilosum]